MRIDRSIENYAAECNLSDEKKSFLYEVAEEVERLLGGACHLFDLADFCYFDTGDDPQEVAYEICMADDLASAYLDG